MATLITDPKILGLTLIGGFAPSLIWLWFWLREDQKRLEPKGLLTLCFIAGMLSVALVLPIQKLIQMTVHSENTQVIAWAAVEEIIKYLAVVLVLWKTKNTDGPVEWPIYLITTALGFAAIENTLFLLAPFSLHETTVGLLTGQLRFLGSTLLHSISSGIIGVSIGLSIYMTEKKKLRYILIGLILAITLHSAFNFFIIENSGSDFLKVFGFLWVVTVIIMLLFEKLRRMSETIEKAI
jgi:RsiW-degrading membrane proteinase PrsW (M82 family)